MKDDVWKKKTLTLTYVLISKFNGTYYILVRFDAFGGLIYVPRQFWVGMCSE